MAKEKYVKSALEEWIREKNMSTNDFIKLIGCSRPTLWKAKRGIPISPAFAKRIEKITKGIVKPLYEPV